MKSFECLILGGSKNGEFRVLSNCPDYIEYDGDARGYHRQIVEDVSGEKFIVYLHASLDADRVIHYLMENLRSRPLGHC